MTAAPGTGPGARLPNRGPGWGAGTVVPAGNGAGVGAMEGATRGLEVEPLGMGE